MYLEIFPADFAVFRVFLGISWDIAEIPEFRGSATARNIRSPELGMLGILISDRLCEVAAHGGSTHENNNLTM